MMSWNLRLYFVITEYLIREFFIPLFSGLTAADNFTTVTFVLQFYLWWNSNIINSVSTFGFPIRSY